jgi:hypothetical protein
VSGRRENAESEYRTGLTYISLANDLKLHAIIDLEDALRQNPELPGGRDVLQTLKDKYAEMNSRLANLSQISPELKARYEALANPVAVTSNLPPGTFALTATADSELERASDELAGGLLTRFLVEGLEGGADLDSDGSITADELGGYVLKRVRAAQARSSRAPSEPLFWSNPPPEGTLVVRGGQHSDIAGVIVAVGDHEDPAAFPHLRQARADGQRVFETFRKFGLDIARLQMLADEAATQRAIAQALEDAASRASSQTLFVFYFAGHSILGDAGDIGLVCFDSKPRHGMRLVTLESVKAAMERAASKSHLLFLDTISSDRTALRLD